MNMPPRTLHRCRISIAVLALLGARCEVMAAGPLPTGGQVVSGNVRIAPAPGSSLDVTQSSQRAVVNWNSFSIGAGNQVRFLQPNAGSATLNRVVGATPSTIAGTLSANGQVFIVNPNGIAITPSGVVDVGGFIASTLSITDQDFQAGVLRFSGTGASERISQDGTIRTQAGGTVVLLGGSVSNSGVVSAPLGKIMVGSGEMATLDLHGDGMLQVALPSTSPPANGGSRIDIGGTLQADGGRVWVGAATAAQAWHDVVNVSGEIVARSVSGRDGAIVLDAGLAGAVNVSGQLVASGDRSAGDIRIGGAMATVDGAHAALIARSDAGQGGSITVAPHAELTVGRALLDVSGATGGGTIRLGGDAHGAGSLVHADRSSIGPDARLLADATHDGTGGRVIVWSDARTDFLGQISARGAGLQGAGGFAEVSSHGLLRFAGDADLRGAPGHTGNLLLDPFDVTISTAADSNHDASFSATGNDSVVNVTTLQNALATANVTVSTGSAGSQAGDITVASPVAWNSGNSLTLSSARDINVNANVTSNGGALALNAGRGVTITSATLNTGGGNLIATSNTTDGTSGLKFDGATIDVGSGTGTLSGNSSSGFGVRFLGLPSTLRASGSGSMTLSGDSTSSHGVVVETDLATAGQVTINGSSNGAFGVDFLGTVITTSGNLAFNGTSNTSNAVWVEGGSTLSLSNTGPGTLSVQGTSSNFNGIRLNNGAALITSGTVQLSGTSLNGGGGFSLRGSNTVTVASGNTTITGTATSPFNAIDMASSGNSVANNGVGTLTLAGNGNVGLAALVTAPSGSLAINASADLLVNTGTQITWPTGSTQTLSAGRDINVNAAIAGSGGLQLNAGRDITINSNITASGGPLNVGLAASPTAGTITINNATIDTGGGNLSATATQSGTANALRLLDATLNVGSGSGALTVAADGDGTFASGNLALLASGGGSITLSTTGNTGSGLFFNTNAVLTTAGTVSVSGASTGKTGLYFFGSNAINAGSGSLSLNGSSANEVGIWFNAGNNTLVATGGLSISGTSTSYRGLGLNSDVSLATTGDIDLAGTSTSQQGLWFNSTNSINANNGTLTLTGSSGSGEGVFIDFGANSFTQSGTGSITLSGNSTASSGVLFNTAASLGTSGNVTLNGSSVNGSGVALTGGNALTASSGSLAVNGGSGSSSGVQFTGADSLTNAGGSITVTGASSSAAGLGLSAGAAVTTTGNLTLSGSGSSTGISLASGATVDNTGSGTLHLVATTGGIDLGSNLVSPNGALWLTSAGTVTQGSGSINASKLLLSGPGAYTLDAAGNQLQTLAANAGAISLHTATDLTVGSVLGTSGITSSGALALRSDGHLSVAAGSPISATSPVLAAGAGHDLSINAAIVASGTMQLSAGRDISVNSDITAAGGPLNMQLAASATAGTIAINNVLIDTGGGNLTASAAQIGGATGILLSGTTLNVGSGTGTLNGRSDSGSGIALTGAVQAHTSGAGALTFNGVGTSGNGITFADDAVVSGSGAIALSGTSISGNGVQLGRASLTQTAGDLAISANSGASISMLIAAGSSISNTGSGVLHLDAATGIDLGAAVSSPNGPLWLSAAGQVTQTGGSITASQLRLSGSSASYGLEAPGNQVQTLAANAGSVALHSGSGLTIGTVLGVSGATTTGNVTFITEGDLAIASGAAVSGANPVLAAGANFINHSGVDAITATSGRWLVYAADPASSVFSGVDSGNTALWSATHASRPPGSVSATGNRYLFALQPVLTATSTDATKVYGDDVSSAIAGNYTVTGFHGGVANAFQGDTAASAYAGAPAVSSIGSTSTASVNAGPYAVAVSQGSLSSSAGYGFTFAGTGRLTVTPRPLAFVATPATRPFGEANPPLQGTVAGFVNGDSLGGVASGKVLWATPADATSLPGTYSIFGSGLSVTSPNYTLAQDPGNAFALTVTPRTLSTVAPPDGVKSTTRAFAENAGAYCVLGPLLTRSEQTRCKLDSDAVRMPVLQEQEAELP